MDAEGRFSRVAVYVYHSGKREEGDAEVRSFVKEGPDGLKGRLMLDDLDMDACVTLLSSEEAMIEHFGIIRGDLDEAMDGPLTMLPLAGPHLL